MSKKLPAVFSIALRFAALLLIAAAGLLVYNQSLRYAALRSVYPLGTTIAEIPVGGLNLGQAVERLKQTYSAVPVELHYRGAVIQMDPTAAGFALDFGTMMANAEVARTSQAFWNGLWNYLWDRPPAAPPAVQLAASFSEERLRVYLKDQVAALYDDPPVTSAPIQGTLDFTPSQPGTALDIDQAVPQIAAALRSRSSRQAELTYKPVAAPRPALSSLQLLLEQTVLLMGYNGTLELYLSNPQSGDKLQLAYDQGKPVAPDIAFTAASTMKIPIMISVFRRQPDPLPADIQAMFAAMIEFSDNDMSDKLMQTIEKNLGPILLTKDIQALGLQNTFLGGYYYPGAPLLQRFETPANQRSDIATAPDVYNQTTPADIGALLENIYTCAEQDQSLMQTVFLGQLTQSKCRQMVEFMAKNRNGVLLEAGLPEGTRVAHKHGWTTESDGLIHTISDAGIVYSPNASYILTIYIHDREQLPWERMNFMIALLSQAVYNFYNLP